MQSLGADLVREALLYQADAALLADGAQAIGGEGLNRHGGKPQASKLFAVEGKGANANVNAVALALGIEVGQEVL
jgi:hypothetical protein